VSEARHRYGGALAQDDTKCVDPRNIQTLMILARGLALDIDETLSLTTKYWVERLQIEIGNPEGLTSDQVIEKYRYAEAAPYWQTAEAYSLMVEWAESNEVQEQLLLIEGADEWVTKVHAIVPIVAYITMRPQSVLAGTKKWLAAHRFPEAPVLVRPDDVPFEQAHEWKANLVTELYPTLFGLVDDRPSVINAFAPEYKGTLFLFGASVPCREDISVVACPTWEDVYEAVVRVYKIDS